MGGEAGRGRTGAVRGPSTGRCLDVPGDDFGPAGKVTMAIPCKKKECAKFAIWTALEAARDLLASARGTLSTRDPAGPGR